MAVNSEDTVYLVFSLYFLSSIVIFLMFRFCFSCLAKKQRTRRNNDTIPTDNYHSPQIPPPLYSKDIPLEHIHVDIGELPPAFFH